MTEGPAPIEVRIRAALGEARDGYALPRFFYTDPDLFEYERRRILLDKWVFACLAAELDQVGSFVTVDYAGESFIVVRAAEDDIRAFFNVCRHRGSRICTQSVGTTRRLVCPYHSWTYRLDGALIATGDTVDFLTADGLAPDALDLHPCDVETLEGLVFINPGLSAPGSGGRGGAAVPGSGAPDPGGPGPGDLEQMRRDLAPFFELHGIAGSRPVARRHHDFAANWKLVLENFHECMHCTVIHPTFSRLHPSAASPSVPSLEVDTELATWLDRVSRAGNDPGRINVRTPSLAQPYRAYRRPYRDGYETHTRDGRPAAPLMGRFTAYDSGNTGVVIEPFFSLQAANDHATVFSIVPLAPRETRITLTWLVAGSADDEDCDIDRIVEVWDVTTAEDRAIVDNNQAGVSSLRYVGGPYQPKEQPTLDMVRWYLAQLEAALAGP